MAVLPKDPFILFSVINTKLRDFYPSLHTERPGWDKNPAILFSVINTKLRDFYPSLDALCADLQVDRAALEAQLAAIGMTYDPSQNKFL